MIKVWVLILYMYSGFQNGGPAVIDNIATREECERIRSDMHGLATVRNQNTICISVTKARL